MYTLKQGQRVATAWVTVELLVVQPQNYLFWVDTILCSLLR